MSANDVLDLQARVAARVIVATVSADFDAITSSSIGVAALPRAESVSMAWACPEGVIPTKKSSPAKWIVAFFSLFAIGFVQPR